MAKHFIGQAPGGRGYAEVGTIADTEGRHWLVYHRARLHAKTTWQSFKLAATEPVPKGNYWMTFNPATGRVGQSRDAKLLAKRAPELYAQLVQMFPDAASQEVQP